MLVKTIKNFLDFKKFILPSSSSKCTGVSGGTTLLCKKEDAFKNMFFMLVNM